MNDQKLKYQSLDSIDKTFFNEKISQVSNDEKCKLLAQLKESNDLDFSEKVFKKYIHSDDLFLAETALRALGYLSIIKKRKMNSSVISELKELAKNKPVLQDVIDDTIWEIEQNKP